MSTLGIIVLVIVSVLVGFFINSIIYHARNGVKIGKPAPGFFVETLTGEKVGHADWDRPPHPVLLVFVSPKCNTCRRLMQLLDELQKKYDKAKMDIIIVGINGNKKDFIEWVAALDLKLQVTIDPEDTIRHKFAVYSLPAMYYISSGGLVRNIHRGYKSNDDKIIEKMFTDRLKRLNSIRRASRPI
ncbi:MAG: TlpA family protein disulfide reductase [Candidatus Marinimicrobia bacterium]|nr:TlpA family protein disulfide reductase [Candidatus Neomarinimicrobiota bacterium]